MRLNDKKKILTMTIGIVAILSGSTIGASGIIRNYTIEKQISLGEQYLLALDYENAIIAFSKILEVDPKYVPAYIGISDAYIGLAEVYIKKEDFTKAESLYQEIIDILSTGLELTQDSSIKEKLEEILGLLKELFKQNQNKTIGAMIEQLQTIIKNQVLLGETNEEVTVIQDNYEIKWEDAVLESMIRQKIGKTNGTIYKNDLSDIKEINIIGDHIIETNDYIDGLINNKIQYLNPYGTVTDVNTYYYQYFENHAGYLINEIVYPYKSGNIQTLNDFRHFENLVNLNIQHQKQLNIEGIKWLKNLRCLDLSYNNISDISSISDLTNLTELILLDNEVVDISVISKLKSLKNIDVRWNNVIDFSPIHNKVGLEEPTTQWWEEVERKQKYNLGKVYDIKEE